MRLKIKKKAKLSEPSVHVYAILFGQRIISDGILRVSLFGAHTQQCSVFTPASQLSNHFCGVLVTNHVCPLYYLLIAIESLEMKQPDFRMGPKPST